MAEKILDVCINVSATGFELGLQPNGGCQNPASGPYYFKYWFQHDDDHPGHEGDSLPLDQMTGRCRIIAWTEEPGIIDVEFGAPTMISPRVILQAIGDGTIGSADPYNPWPTA